MMGTLCCLNISNDCPGVCSLEELFVDDDGSTWDYCKACAKKESEVGL